MASIDHGKKRIYATLCYAGCPGSGKLANLRFIDVSGNGTLSRLSVDHWPDQGRIASHTSVVLDGVHGYEVDLALHALHNVPDEHPLLAEADAIVLVIDSSPDRLEDNRRVVLALRPLLDRLPFVVQLNKREVEGALEPGWLGRQLGLEGAPMVEASAKDGSGVLETLKLAAQLALSRPQGAEVN